MASRRLEVIVPLGRIGAAMAPTIRRDRLSIIVATESGRVFLRASYVSNSSNCSPNVDVLILGGRPIRETVAWYGPFVMNNRAELVQAFEDYEAGKLGTIPADRIDRRHPHDVS